MGTTDPKLQIKVKTSATIVVATDILLTEQGLDGENIAPQRTPHAKIARKWDISTICKHVDPKKWHVSRFKLSIALDLTIMLKF